MVVLDLPYSLSFKVIYEFEGRTYTNHDTSPLLLHVEMQYVLPAYGKSWSQNPLVTLVLTCDLSFKVICNFEGQTYTNHAISSL